VLILLDLLLEKMHCLALGFYVLSAPNVLPEMCHNKTVQRYLDKRDKMAASSISRDAPC